MSSLFGSEEMLFDFDKIPAGRGWEIVDDGVMGGISRGNVSVKGGIMRFWGELSLENNGGFSSVRNNTILDLSRFDGIRLRVKGDGRSYQLRFETDARYKKLWSVSYRGNFDTVKDKWIEVDIPIDQLRQSFRGRELSGYGFDASKVRMIGFLLADKKQASFELEVDWVKAITAE